MYKTLSTLLALIVSMQAFAHKEECENILQGHEIQLKNIGRISLPGQPNTKVEFVDSLTGVGTLTVLDNDTSKYSFLTINRSNSLTQSPQKTLGSEESSLKQSQIMNYPTIGIVAGLKNATKTLHITDGVREFTLPELPPVRHWKLIKSNHALYLVVATNNSLIVLQNVGREFQIKAELKDQALFTSLDVHNDGADLYIVGKGDLRAHIAKYSGGRLTMVKQVVQLGGEIYSAMTERGLVFASIDRSDRLVNFYSLNEDKRSENFPLSGEIGRVAWLKLGDGRTVFVLNTGSRTTSYLLMFSGEDFKKVENVVPRLQEFKGAVDHLSVVQFDNRDYIIFSQQGRQVRLVNHVDENMMTADVGMSVRQVTAPFRTHDGRIVIAVVSSNSKKAQVDLIQIGN